MKLRNTLLTLLGALALTASAIPARKGAVHLMPQPDGSMVSLELVGDEHSHYYLTSDQKIVIDGDGQYSYAIIDAFDQMVNSGVMAHNPSERTLEENALVASINTDLVREKMFQQRTGMSRANNQDGSGKLTTNFPTKGEVKSIVILVEYQDVAFETENPGEYFSRLLNEPGFSENGAQGSAVDFYTEASNGQFLPSFDVYGPVVLPNDRAYYGANSATGIDKRAPEMMLHAGQILDDVVDFSQYDLDNDKFVDNVYIFYAGASEADGAGADCVWPHQYSVGYNTKYRFDGVQLNRYACGSELAGGKPDGIGTFCHEFGHVLGLPDIYNPNDMAGNYTPLSYTLMDQGCYNGNGNLPPTLSAFERNALGWMGDDLVEITGPATCSLGHLLETNKAYLINTDQSNEYFILENRQQTGWDKKIPYHGMLIWHIEYDKRAFNNNAANSDPEHQLIDLVEACGFYGSSFLTLRKYPFPGALNKTSFTFDTNPSFQSWSGADLGLPITDITESDGIITFNVAGGGPDPAGINDVVINKDFSCTVSGKTVSVVADGTITIVDLSGRILATGKDTLNADLNHGIYIISTPQGSRKLSL